MLVNYVGANRANAITNKVNRVNGSYWLRT